MKKKTKVFLQDSTSCLDECNQIQTYLFTNSRGSSPRGVTCHLWQQWQNCQTLARFVGGRVGLGFPDNPFHGATASWMHTSGHLMGVTFRQRQFKDNLLCAGESNLFSSRFSVSVMDVLQFSSLSMSLFLKLIGTAIERSHMMFLHHKFRPCLIVQIILVTFKKRFSQISRISIPEHRTFELISR